MVQTIITDINLDDVINMLAFLDSMNALVEAEIKEALEFLVNSQEGVTWEIQPLVDQVKERSAVLR